MSGEAKSIAHAGEIWEEYHRITHPEFYEQLEREWERSKHNELNKKLLRRLAELGGEAGYAEIQRQRWRRHLSKFDTSFLSELGLTLDDVIDLMYSKRAKVRNGRQLPQSPRKRALRQTALRAIQTADFEGRGWADAIRFVQERCAQEHDAEPSVKTIQSWLTELSITGAISIEKPDARGRGRPQKKRNS